MVSTTSSPEHAQGVNTSKLDALVTEFMLAEGLVEVCRPCVDTPPPPPGDPPCRSHCLPGRSLPAAHLHCSQSPRRLPGLQPAGVVPSVIFVQTQAAEAARWGMRTRCEAVRGMIAAGDVQGAMDAVCAVDASILKVSCECRTAGDRSCNDSCSLRHAASQCCRRCIVHAYTALVSLAEAHTAYSEPSVQNGGAAVLVRSWQGRLRPSFKLIDCANRGLRRSPLPAPSQGSAVARRTRGCCTV